MNNTLSVFGSKNVAKIIDALTDNQNTYTIIIEVDSFQSCQPDDKRSYMVKIADKFAGEVVEIITEDEMNDS